VESRLQLEISAQPDNTTCGPTCLHSVYRYFGDEVPLSKVIAETPALPQGGTLAVLLGCHALHRGYKATIFTYNLQVFDPTWFREDSPPLADRIRAQMEVKDKVRLQISSRAYLEFLRLGGEIRMEDMTANLIRRYLKRSVPILAGLSSTYLYNEKREFGERSNPDDVRGLPQGHFVVLCGYDSVERQVLVADPLESNPLSSGGAKYVVDLDRLMCAIMLGIVTYDANLLVIRRKERHSGERKIESTDGIGPTAR
jgi:hypothetical protein